MYQLKVTACVCKLQLLANTFMTFHFPKRNFTKEIVASLHAELYLQESCAQRGEPGNEASTPSGSPCTILWGG